MMRLQSLTMLCRSFRHGSVYTALNIIGLAVGLAASLALLLYVRHEWGYDRWLPDSERVFQVQSVLDNRQTGETGIDQSTHGAVADALAGDFPQIEAISRADSAEPVIIEDGVPRFAEMFLVDEAFLQVISLPLVRGDATTALSDPNSLVLSETEAINRFGTVDALGRTVSIVRDGSHRLLRVTGVFRDIPSNSHMPFALVSRLAEPERAACGWGCMNGYVYLKLRPGADVDQIQAALPAWERRNIPPRRVGNLITSEGELYDWRLVNVRDVHLSGAEGPLLRPGSSRATLTTFALVALLVLGIAVVNFVNLATARAGRRAREVALRKVLGARRRQLIVQFLGESLLITGAAMLAALAFLELFLPYLSRFMNVGLVVSYFGDDGIILPVLGLWLGVALAGGLYPAYFLSRYRPADVLKANQSAAEPHGTGRLRTALVIVQFAVSIGLIACALTIYAQTAFLRSSDLGFEDEGLLQIANLSRSEVAGQSEAIIREVERIDGVEAATASSIAVAATATLNTRVNIPGQPEPAVIGLYSARPDFARVMGIRLIAGRQLSERYAHDSAAIRAGSEESRQAARRQVARRGINVLVNRAAARSLGFVGPSAALGRQISFNLFGEAIGPVPATIVGVVDNSRFRSARAEVEPMILIDRGTYRTLIVRYRSSDPEGVRQAVARVWRRFAPQLPFEASFVEDQLERLYAAEIGQGRALGLFAVLAIVIACLGLFGLAAFAADKRTREIGIRKVFGARTQDIVMLLVWQFTRPVIAANLIAWPIAYLVMRNWLNGFSSRIELGPGPFLVAGLMAVSIAAGTVAGHALRVARTNPVKALRYE